MIWAGNKSSESCTIPGKNTALLPISQSFLWVDVEPTQHMGEVVFLPLSWGLEGLFSLINTLLELNDGPSSGFCLLYPSTAF